MRSLQVVVVPFSLQRGQLVAVGHEPAKSTEAGSARAKKLADRYDGVGVYGVWVDDVTLDACDLHEIAREGTIPELEVLQAAA